MCPIFREIVTLAVKPDAPEIYPTTFNIAACCENTFNTACVMSPDSNGLIEPLVEDVVVLQNTGQCGSEGFYLYEPVRIKDVPTSCGCVYPAPTIPQNQPSEDS